MQLFRLDGPDTVEDLPSDRLGGLCLAADDRSANIALVGRWLAFNRSPATARRFDLVPDARVLALPPAPVGYDAGLRAAERLIGPPLVERWKSTRTAELRRILSRRYPDERWNLGKLRHPMYPSWALVAAAGAVEARRQGFDAIFVDGLAAFPGHPRPFLEVCALNDDAVRCVARTPATHGWLSRLVAVKA